MKKALLVSALILSSVTLIRAQRFEPSSHVPSAMPSVSAVIERGEHHRVWARPVFETNQPGKVSAHTNTYVELETGMHYWADGAWQESKELIETYPGGAIARQGPHKVIFANNLNTAVAIDLEMPDGRRLRSHVLGLSYFDTATGESVLIAEVKDRVGLLLPPNQILYTNAFTDFIADVRYTYRKSGLEQDVILRSQPPSPAVWGLNPASTRLQILTEFMDPPAPQKRTTQAAVEGVTDDTLNFGGMRIGHGKAFGIGGLQESGHGVRVFKQWSVLEGRTFLIEEVPFVTVESKLNGLPVRTAAIQRKSKAGKGENVIAALITRLPRLAATRTGGAVHVAKVDLQSEPGFLLDYEVASGATNLTFRGDTTYYCTNTVNLYETTVLEGGAVIKLSTNASAKIVCMDRLACRTASYRPAIFTAKDDDTVGTTITDSTGSPGGYYGETALVLPPESPESSTRLRNIRFIYQKLAMDAANATGYEGFPFSDLQFVSCQAAVNSYENEFSFWNCLFNDVGTNFLGPGAIIGEHLTFNRCGELMVDWESWENSALKLTNCLGVLVTNLGSNYILTTNRCAILTDDPGVFQTVGAGAHYLAVSSPYRDIGTTNISETLLADLSKRTTYPPQLLTNTETTDVVLSLQPARDTDVPDLGYHYDPLDYLSDVYTITNATLTLTNGVAVGSYHTAGIWLQDGSQIVSIGSPSGLNRLVRYGTVQEQPLKLGDWTLDNSASVYPYAYGGAVPTATFRFTEFCALANGGYHLISSGSNSRYANLAMRDNVFNSGTLQFQTDVSDTIGCTNNLFERSILTVAGTGQFFFRNNLFRHGELSLLYSSTNSWELRDNSLEGCAIYDPSPGSIADHNAYIDAVGTLSSTNGSDLFLSNFSYTNGPLGNYYQVSTNLLNGGSTTADVVGLYHYTTLTNQLKETNSTVDIGFHYVATDGNGSPLDTDGDGLADYSEDSNGNGLWDGSETDYLEYYNGVLPQLTIVSGDNQVGMPGSWLPLPLIVAVASTNGNPLSGAPVTYAVSSGAAQVATATNGTPTASVDVLSDSAGEASVFALLPSSVNSTNSITVTASIGTNSVQVTFAASTIAGVKLWLKADVGVATNISNQVTNWLDQSGCSNNATPPFSSAYPQFVSGALNGLPVVRFDGNARRLYLPNFLTNFTAADVFVMLKAATNRPTGNRALWQMGKANVTSSYYPHSTTYILDDFGRTNSVAQGFPAQRIDQYHVYNVLSTLGEWTTRINGKVHYTTTNNAVGFPTNPRIGFDDDNASFDGDIAEVLLFNRVLSSEERSLVGVYLNQRYGWITNAPPVPAGLSAAAIATNQVALWWTNSLENYTIAYTIERKTGAGSYSQIAVVSDGTSYLDTGVEADTEYTYRLKAATYAGESDYSAEVSVTTPESGASLPLNDLKLWLKADIGVVRNNTNGTVALWLDQSGNGNGAVQSTLNSQPWLSNTVFNGFPAIRFFTTNFFTLPNFLTNLTQAEVFVLLKAKTNRPSGNRGLWRLGPANGSDYYPSSASGNYISDSFGRTNNPSTGTPFQRVDSYHLYNVASQVGSWVSRINGRVHYTMTNTAVSFASTPYLGQNDNGGSRFDGDVAELLLFNRVLSSEERSLVGVYLNQRYGWITNAPPVPVGLSAVAIATNQVALWWTNSLENYTTAFTIERKTGAGSYSTITAVSDGNSYLDTEVEADTEYTYRLKAATYAGESDYSAEVSVTTPESGASLPLSDLKLWLKADIGVVRNNTNGTVGLWLDQSGYNNHAVQSLITLQPLPLEGVVNGLPIVRFVSSQNRYFSLPNFLGNFEASEAFVVLNCVTNTPATGRGLWRIGTYGTPSVYPSSTGHIIESFGCNSFRDLGVPAQDLKAFHLYNPAASHLDWQARINGAILMSSNGNSLSFSSSPLLGNNGNSWNFDGDMAEVLFFNKVLADEERFTVMKYLNGRYALVSTTTPVPVSLTATGAAPYELSISWSNAALTYGVLYTVERCIGTNGDFAPIAWTEDRTWLDETALPGTNYSYRIKASCYASDPVYSTNISPPAVTLTDPVADPVAVFTSGTNVVVSAVAADLDGSITNVEFFLNGQLFATDSSSPYSVTLSNLSSGSFLLTARASDDQNHSAFSAPLRIIGSPDSDGDGINDYTEIENGTNPYDSDTDGDTVPDDQDAFPLDPTRSTLPSSDPSDVTPPVITLEEPDNAALLP